MLLHSVRLLIAESSFVAAWSVASFGVKFLPKDHPLHTYHAYSKSRVKRAYIESARVG